MQLTGRDNYRRYGRRLDLPLEQEPDLALDPATAARLTAAFLSDRRLRIRMALLQGALEEVRKLVNGGTHGLERFLEAFDRADASLPN